MKDDKDISQIPHGPYCYEIVEWSEKISLENGKFYCRPLKYKVCPYWELREDKPEQDNGYCRYLGIGDWEDDGFGLLWDQVKACGINEDDEEEHCNGQGETDKSET